LSFFFVSKASEIFLFFIVVQWDSVIFLLTVDIIVRVALALY